MESNFEEKSFFSDNNSHSFIHIDQLLNKNEKEDKEYMDNKNNLLKGKKQKQKEELKKEKNRISAKKSRNKKNLEIQMLMNENRKLRKQNIQLKEKIKEIKDKLPSICEKCKKISKKFFPQIKSIYFIYIRNHNIEIYELKFYFSKLKKYLINERIKIFLEY